MRVDLRRLIAKGTNKKLVDSLVAYVDLMAKQGKPVERVIVTHAQYDALMRVASSQGRRVVLCCGDALVYFNHGPIDESPPEASYRMTRFSANLPPVAVNPFGVAAPAPKPHVNYGSDTDFDDDDIPF